MRSRGPLITLLAGLALAGMLVTLSVNASRDAELASSRANAPAAGGADSADLPADAAPEEEAAQVDPEAGAAGQDEYGGGGDQAEDSTEAEQANNLNLTWAGRVKGSDAWVAITAKGDEAIAYVCNGSDIEVWMQGTAADGKLDLSAKDSTDALTGTFDEAKAKGSVVLGDETFSFTAKKASKPSGLYRSTADVRGAKLVGGWIVLADGTQVGVATFAGAPVPAPRLDVQSRTVTMYGETMTAAPAQPGDLS